LTNVDAGDLLVVTGRDLVGAGRGSGEVCLHGIPPRSTRPEKRTQNKRTNP
jgi:hypothetical protein